MLLQMCTFFYNESECLLDDARDQRFGKILIKQDQKYNKISTTILRFANDEGYRFLTFIPAILRN